MSRKHHGRRVTAEITIHAPAADVWRAWADPEHIAQWFVDRAEGTAKAGEVMTWMFAAFDMQLPVPIIEAEPGRTFVTGADNVGPLPVLMEVELDTVDGATRLRLVNSGFSEAADHDDEVEGVRSGWALALATLKYWLERRPPGARTARLAMRPVAATWATLAELYGGAAGLGRWLDDVEAPAKLAVGDRITATLGGRPLSGAVLAHSGRELLVEWSELGGTLGIKAFKLGPNVAIGLDLSTWGPAVGDDIVAVLNRGLDRIAAAAA